MKGVVWKKYLSEYFQTKWQKLGEPFVLSERRHLHEDLSIPFSLKCSTDASKTNRNLQPHDLSLTKRKEPSKIPPSNEGIAAQVHKVKSSISLSSPERIQMLNVAARRILSQNEQEFECAKTEAERF